MRTAARREDEPRHGCRRWRRCRRSWPGEVGCRFGQGGVGDGRRRRVDGGHEGARRAAEAARGGADAERQEEGRREAHGRRGERGRRAAGPEGVPALLGQGEGVRQRQAVSSCAPAFAWSGWLLFRVRALWAWFCGLPTPGRWEAWRACAAASARGSARRTVPATAAGAAVDRTASTARAIESQSAARATVECPAGAAVERTAGAAQGVA